MTRRDDMILALVAEIWGRTEMDDGSSAEYRHCCENGLERPPEILERLGYVIAVDGGMAHAFPPGWLPGEPPRHSPNGKPVDEADLREALQFLHDWRGPADTRIFSLFYGNVPLVPDTETPLPAPPPGGAGPDDEQARIFRRWAASRILALLS